LAQNAQNPEIPQKWAILAPPGTPGISRWGSLNKYIFRWDFARGAFLKSVGFCILKSAKFVIFSPFSYYRSKIPVFTHFLCRPPPGTPPKNVIRGLKDLDLGRECCQNFPYKVQRFVGSEIGFPKIGPQIWYFGFQVFGFLPLQGTIKSKKP